MASIANRQPFASPFAFPDPDLSDYESDDYAGMKLGAARWVDQPRSRPVLRASLATEGKL